MKKLILGAIIAVMMSSTCLAENWWDSGWFNYGVGAISIVAGISLNSTADNLAKQGHESISDAQYYADMSGYYYALGSTSTSNLYASWSNESKADADSKFGSSATNRGYFYALLANGLWLIGRGISNSLAVKVANNKVSMGYEIKY